MNDKNNNNQTFSEDNVFVQIHYKDKMIISSLNEWFATLPNGSIVEKITDVILFCKNTNEFYMMKD